MGWCVRWCGVAALVFGCGTDAKGELTVDVVTDLAPIAEFDAVVVDVLEDRRPELASEHDWLAGVRFGPFDVDQGAVTVRASAVLDGEVVVGREARVLVRGRTGATLILTRDCVGVVCPGADDSPSALACLGGRCVMPECFDGTEDACPDTIDCSNDMECPSTSCSMGVCSVGGVCLARDNCAANQYCAPEVDECRGLPGVDLTDAGIEPPPDAGTDECSIDQECDDQDECTNDRCASGRCEHPRNGMCTTVQIASSGRFGCAVRDDGTVHCWGDNLHQQVAPDEALYYPRPVPIAGITDAVAVSTGNHHACTLHGDGAMRCWGYALSLGRGFEGLSPFVVATGVTQVSAPGLRTCFIRDGEVWCLGSGALGNGTAGNTATAVRATGLSDVVQIDGGAEHTCALTSSGEVWCWGRNSNGELGNGEMGTQITTPTRVPGINDATLLAAGRRHTCVVRAGAALWCWGDNEFGQLGDGTTSDRATPAVVPGVINPRVVAASDHTCALGDDGVSCWGNNADGQLGDGSTVNRTSPVSATGTASSFALGWSHTCVQRDAEVWCRGASSLGELGDGSAGRLTPVAVDGVDAAVSIATTTSRSCAALSNGEVWCWGLHPHRWSSMPDADPRPSPIDGVSGAIQVGGFASNYCAVTASGEVRCWGNNSDGQLGDGTTNARSDASLVTGISNASKVSVGFNFACAVLSDGAIRCWGRNSSGNFGDGTENDSSVPVPSVGLSDVIDIGCGWRHVCALQSGGSAMCWGYGSLGRLGDGTEESRSTPAPVLTLSDGTSISSGHSHSCTVRQTGQTVCWGRAIGSTAGNQLTPTAVPSVTSATTGGGGERFACVVEGGRARCWGSNDFRQLGTATEASAVLTPVEVDDLSNVVAVSAATTHACAIVASGQVFCWGDQTHGKLGHVPPWNEVRVVGL